jgi:hydroxyacylglutathione hydrolase
MDMMQIYDDLWQTKLEIPFGSVHTHAYYLRSTEGPVLLYNTSHADEIQSMAELGGIQYQLLSHRDEAGPSLVGIKAQFESTLCCHAKEEPSVTKACWVDVTFTEPMTECAGIEVRHTPGHTDGSMSFLYRSPYDRTYLFTGDTLFQTNGRWDTIVFESNGGSTEDLIESLVMYRSLRPDVVLWSASGGGDVSFVELNHAQWTDAIDDRVRHLRQV